MDLYQLVPMEFDKVTDIVTDFYVCECEIIPVNLELQGLFLTGLCPAHFP